MFLKVMLESSNPNLVVSKQFSLYINYIWEKKFKRPVFGICIVSLIYISTTIYYYVYHLAKVDGQIERTEFLEKSCVSGVIWLLIFYNIFWESSQLWKEKSDYIDLSNGIWNIFDLTSLCLNLFIMTAQNATVNANTLSVIASLAMIFLFMKLFYWLRFFKMTQQYVRMVSDIIVDSAKFAIVFFACVAMFAMSFAILDNNSGDNNLYTKRFGFPFDSLLYAYMLGLGEFNTDPYDTDNNTALLWIYFLVATYVIQLVFLNLLIAIMGSSYEKMIEI